MRRPIKRYNSEEISRIREACTLGRKALDLAHRFAKIGVTTEEIDYIVYTFIVSNGGYPSPLKYYGFPRACCTSVNEVVCHGIPDSRPLRDGDIVNVDITVYYQRMHGDLNETFLVGEVSEAAKKLVRATYEALKMVIPLCKPNQKYDIIGKTIQPHLNKQGYSVVQEYTGHGIGDVFHTKPYVAHTTHGSGSEVMHEGHVFTIEPMVNEGKKTITHWPDDWTAVTSDGSLSAQFEHQLLITADGCEVLTERLPDSPALRCLD